MKKRIGFLGIILIGLFLFSSCAGLRINKELESRINFRDKESILKLEQDPALFRLWTEWKPIKLLMTGEEKKIVKEILKMEDTVKRDRYSRAFIKFFWQRRDDNLYDDVNEFKDNFYDRVVEAQTRFAREEDASYYRKCTRGKGWQTDMGLIYIVLGEPFDKSRQDVAFLLTLFSGHWSALMPEKIEIWHYDLPDDYDGMFIQDGNAWMLFERDMSGWQFAEKTFSLFYAYENYYESYFSVLSLNYSIYIGAVYKFVEAVAESYIYDWDLEFEDVLKE